MFPIGGLLESLSLELKVPGQDAPVVWTANAGWPNTAYAGIYINTTTGGFNVDGYLARRNNSTYTQQTDMWIHSDFRAYVNSADYEFRYFNVTGDTAFLDGSPWVGTVYDSETGWQSGDTDPNWRLYANGPQFGNQFNSVTGIISVREKANHANIRTGNLGLTATYEGEL